MKTRLSIIKEQVENILEAIATGREAQIIAANAAKKKAEESGQEVVDPTIPSRPTEVSTAIMRANQQAMKGLLTPKGAAKKKVTQVHDEGVGRVAHAGRAHTMTDPEVQAANLAAAGARTRLSPRAVPVKMAK